MGVKPVNQAGRAPGKWEDDLVGEGRRGAGRRAGARASERLRRAVVLPLRGRGRLLRRRAHGLGGGLGRGLVQRRLLGCQRHGLQQRIVSGPRSSHRSPQVALKCPLIRLRECFLEDGFMELRASSES